MNYNKQNCEQIGYYCDGGKEHNLMYNNDDCEVIEKDLIKDKFYE